MNDDIADDPQTSVPALSVPAGIKELSLLQTGRSMQKCVAHLDLEAVAAFDDIIQDLAGVLTADHDGSNELEALLAAQARILDAAFHRSIDAALGKTYYDEERMALALKAQRQCRNTVQALRALQIALLKAKTKNLKKVTNELLDND